MRVVVGSVRPQRLHGQCPVARDRQNPLGVAQAGDHGLVGRHQRIVEQLDRVGDAPQRAVRIGEADRDAHWHRHDAAELAGPEDDEEVVVSAQLQDQRIARLQARPPQAGEDAPRAIQQVGVAQIVLAAVGAHHHQPCRRRSRGGAQQQVGQQRGRVGGGVQLAAAAKGRRRCGHARVCSRLGARRVGSGGHRRAFPIGQQRREVPRRRGRGTRHGHGRHCG